MSDWQFPGARWWKFDFHAHTPASTDFADKGMTPESWLRGFMESGIDCVAITDHNSGKWIDKLRHALGTLDREPWYRPVHLFPGVEISANGGVHILAIFDPSRTTGDIDSLLGAVDYRGTKGSSDAVTGKSLAEVIDLTTEYGGIAIPAHVDKRRGLFESMQGKSLAYILSNPNIQAMELCDQDYSRPELYASEKTSWIQVLGSDYHGHNASALGVFTWVKMGMPSIEGLRLALIDGSASVNRDMDAEPNQHAEHVIEGFDVKHARYMGRPNSLTCQFSPFLNAIVGSRGSGKSTLLEFMRLTLRQERQLPDRLEEDYRHYFNSDADGLLAKDSHLQLCYRKGNTRYRLNWAENPDIPSLEEQDEETGEWHQEEGEIASLFPAAIYSQKQIFELASNPQGLLGIIDKAPEVGHKEYLSAFRDCSNSCRQLHQQMTQLAQKISEENQFKGQLNDVARQIKQVEQSDHRNLLRKYRSRKQQLREIDYVEQHWQGFLDALRREFDGFDAAAIDVNLFDQHPEILGALQDKQNQWQQHVKQILKIIESQEKSIRHWKAEKGKQEWMKALDKDLQLYEQLQVRLEKEGVDPNVYPELLQKHSWIEEELQQIKNYRKQRKELTEQYQKKVAEAERFRTEFTDRRRRFLEKVLEDNGSVQITIDSFGEPWATVEKTIRKILQAGDRFQRDIDELESIYVEGGWRKVKQRILDIRLDREKAHDERFKTHIKNLPNESMIEVRMWFPEDALQITYGSNRKKLRQSSPGQKSAALLAFILAYGDEPLLLDQPEDDLDNSLIYSLIVQTIKSTKTKRQIIVVTHNANIVVNGDSEMVHCLEAVAGQSRLKSESLQSAEIRKRICDTMEGGTRAFEQRYRRIHLED
ncbi:MAG: AAA family ATPase [Gammaproteobacteria bacterium]|nr:AAA family ATPase [Gammaproteobacteria bacterium]MCY4227412.1 AAA family ATPase [Gammaproteobacteria bacterium]